MGGRPGRGRRGTEETERQLTRLAQRLGEAVPDAQRHTIVHGDYRIDNCLFDPADPGRILAVLDWEMSTLGDPMADLGLLLIYWYQSEAEEDPVWRDAQHLPSPTRLPGFPRRADVAAAYARGSGLDLAPLPWYVAFGAFKLAVVLAGILARVRAGDRAGGDGARHRGRGRPDGDAGAPRARTGDRLEMGVRPYQRRRRGPSRRGRRARRARRRHLGRRAVQRGRPVRGRRACPPPVRSAGPRPGPRQGRAGRRRTRAAGAVRVLVRNGGGQRGQANLVAAQLGDLGFAEAAPPDNDPFYPEGDMECVGQLRFGAGRAGAATLALVLPCTELVRDDRPDDTVEVAVGTAFGDVNPGRAARDALDQLAAPAGARTGRATPDPNAGRHARGAPPAPRWTPTLLRGTPRGRELLTTVPRAGPAAGRVRPARPTRGGQRGELGGDPGRRGEHGVGAQPVVGRACRSARRPPARRPPPWR